MLQPLQLFCCPVAHLPTPWVPESQIAESRAWCSEAIFPFLRISLGYICVTNWKLFPEHPSYPCWKYHNYHEAKECMKSLLNSSKVILGQSNINMATGNPWEMGIWMRKYNTHIKLLLTYYIYIFKWDGWFAIAMFDWRALLDILHCSGLRLARKPLVALQPFFQSRAPNSTQGSCSLHLSAVVSKQQCQSSTEQHNAGDNFCEATQIDVVALSSWQHMAECSYDIPAATVAACSC